jgi:hypothetical protein
MEEMEWKRIKPTIDRIFEDKIRIEWFSKIHTQCETFVEFEDKCLNFPSLKFIPEGYHKIILRIFGSEKNLNYHYFWYFSLYFGEK